jgi:hypothetical protein
MNEPLLVCLNFSPQIATLASARMKALTVLLLALTLLSCDGGLTPPPDVEPGFGGKIVFEPGTWPPTDSLINLWLVASQIYPLDSVKIFSGIFSNPPAIFLYPDFSTSLPLYVDSVTYAFYLPPATYRYIAILQQFGSEINIRSFRVVGVYGLNGSSADPQSVTLHEFQFIPNINLKVDFHKLPPQPF